MLILPKITVLAPNGFSLKIAPKTTFNTKSFEIRPIGVTFRSIRPVYNGWLVNSKTNFSDLPASSTGTIEPHAGALKVRRPQEGSPCLRRVDRFSPTTPQPLQIPSPQPSPFPTTHPALDGAVSSCSKCQLGHCSHGKRDAICSLAKRPRKSDSR